MRPLLAVRPQRWVQNTFLSLFKKMSKSCTYCSPESKHFHKMATCPFSRVYEATLQGPVYMVTASISGSQSIAGTSLSPVPLIQFATS